MEISRARPLARFEKSFMGLCNKEILATGVNLLFAQNKHALVSRVSMSSLLVYAWFAVTCGIVGCGCSDLVPVEGIVTFDGAPLPNARVTMNRMSGPVSERVCIGKTDAQGHYVLSRLHSHTRGVAVGSYRVMITTVEIPDEANMLTKFPRERVPRKYCNGSIVFTVPESGTNSANFDIVSR